MKIKRLEIIGFKSFVDKVAFDFPEDLFAGEYPRMYALVNDYTRQLSATARYKFYGQNATRFYGISD